MRSQALHVNESRQLDVHFVSLCFVAEVSLEQAEEVVHFNAEFLTRQLVIQYKGECEMHTSRASGGAVVTSLLSSFFMVVAARLLLVLS